MDTENRQALDAEVRADLQALGIDPLQSLDRIGSAVGELVRAATATSNTTRKAFETCEYDVAVEAVRHNRGEDRSEQLEKHQTALKEAKGAYAAAEDERKRLASLASRLKTLRKSKRLPFIEIPAKPVATPEPSHDLGQIATPEGMQLLAFLANPAFTSLWALHHWLSRQPESAYGALWPASMLVRVFVNFRKAQREAPFFRRMIPNDTLAFQYAHCHLRAALAVELTGSTSPPLMQDVHRAFALAVSKKLESPEDYTRALLPRLRQTGLTTLEAVDEYVTFHVDSLLLQHGIDGTPLSLADDLGDNAVIPR